MKNTMRDKVCQLIGKYQYLEEDFKSKSLFKSGMYHGPYGPSEESIKSTMCNMFVDDLKKLLEEGKENDDEA